MTFLNACRNGQKSIVQIFLKKGGIDVNKRDAEGNTPVVLCVPERIPGYCKSSA